MGTDWVEKAKKGMMRLNDAYSCLEEIVRKESKDWDFDKWYADGIDCYLAREVIYLSLETFPYLVENEDAGDSDEMAELVAIIDGATPEQIAKTAWEYAQSMDDFTRLWNVNDWKVSVVREFCEELEKWQEK